jgi:Recombination endonuclease VII
MKICSKCHTNKPDSEYSKAGLHPNGKQKYRSDCKSCKNTYAKNVLATSEQNIRKAQRLALWKAKNVERDAMHRRRSRWKSAGINPDLAEAYYLAHDGRCEMCQENSQVVLCMDHDHITGKIRGMLCHPCNLLLGHARDSQRILVAGIDYLNRHH